MSAWPWMQGCDVAIAQPIAPVNKDDDRPAILELIREHQDGIIEMKQALVSDPLYNPAKHDDLWILRFLLSHKNKISAALKAAQYTLKFRQEHKLDETDLRPFPPTGRESHCKAAQRFSDHVQPGSMCQFLPDARRGAISYIDLSGVDMHKIVESIDESDFLPFFLRLGEWMHQWSDYVSRTTGRLTKALRIVNLDGYTMRQWNREYSRRNQRVIAILHDIYPQMVSRVFICHAPGWVESPWRMFRRVLPKRIVEKLDFVSPNQRAADTQKLLKFLDHEKLPERLGGSYTTWPINSSSPLASSQ